MRITVLDEAKAAKELGVKKFESDRICMYGHQNENGKCLRYTVDRRCVRCVVPLARVMIQAEAKLAKSKGLTRFESVNVCQHDHKTSDGKCLRYAAGSHCVQCQHLNTLKPGAFENRAGHYKRWRARNPRSWEAHNLRGKIRYREKIISELKQRSLGMLTATVCRKIANSEEKLVTLRARLAEIEVKPL